MKKRIQKISQTILMICFCFALCTAQDNPFTQQYKAGVVKTLSKMMNDFYVFPDVAKETEVHLMKLLDQGHFDQFTNDESFAEALTEAVQSINHDKHMRIRKNRPYVAPEKSPQRAIEEQLDSRNRSRTSNLGVHHVQLMEGNVGYFDLRGFAGIHSGKTRIDASMHLIENADAVIFDMSQNGGGDPEMVRYLCSYFFEGGIHLNSLYFREGDRTMEFWTLDTVAGKKMLDVPVFVITSDKTFSGAEEFSYNMQTQKRALIVGQTSGGGANPGRSRSINNNLTVFIPTGKAINPITNTNWEGVGVVPDIKTEVGESKNEAYALAKKAAETYRADVKKKYTKMYMTLISHLDEYEKDTSEKVILEALTECTEGRYMREWQINAMGYDYLLEHKKPMIALSIFRANTLLFPNSPNAFDSYAEAFMMNGDLEASKKYYQKAVDIATKHEDRDLEFYQKNLDTVLEKIKDKAGK